jgi:hypothetical protein
MRLVFRPEARRELLEAQAWYEARATGLGLEFGRAVDAAVEQALRLSLAHTCLDDDFGTYSCEGFHTRSFTTSPNRS